MKKALFFSPFLARFVLIRYPGFNGAVFPDRTFGNLQVRGHPIQLQIHAGTQDGQAGREIQIPVPREKEGRKQMRA